MSWNAHGRRARDGGPVTVDVSGARPRVNGVSVHQRTAQSLSTAPVRTTMSRSGIGTSGSISRPTGRRKPTTCESRSPRRAAPRWTSAILSVTPRSATRRANFALRSGRRDEKRDRSRRRCACFAWGRRPRRYRAGERAVAPGNRRIGKGGRWPDQGRACGDRRIRRCTVWRDCRRAVGGHRWFR